MGLDPCEAAAGHAAYAGGWNQPAYNKVADSSGAGRAGYASVHDDGIGQAG